jgi:hypothetical protein
MLDEKGSEARLAALTTLRKELRNRTAPAAEAVMESVMAEILVQIIGDPTANEQELIIATEIVNNIASCKREITLQLIEMNVIPAMVNLCKNSRVVAVLESAVWALGNIAGEAADTRNLVIEAGTLDVLLALIELFPTKLSLMRICIWCASNLPRGGAWPDDLLRLAPTVARFLRASDKELVVDALWTLSFLSDGPNHRQTILVAVPGLVKSVIHWLGAEEVLLVPALRACGNLLSGDNQAADALIEENVIQGIVPLLTHRKNGICKEACWSLSNIFGGTTTQINKCLVAGALVPLLNIIRSEHSPYDLRKEAQWCIANMLTGCAPEDFQLIFDKPHLLHILKDIIAHRDADLPTYGITGALRLCAWSEKTMGAWDEANPFIDAISNLHEIIENHGLTHTDAAILSGHYLGAPRVTYRDWLVEDF